VQRDVAPAGQHHRVCERRRREGRLVERRKGGTEGGLVR